MASLEAYPRPWLELVPDYPGISARRLHDAAVEAEMVRVPGLASLRSAMWMGLIDMQRDLCGESRCVGPKGNKNWHWHVWRTQGDSES